MESLKSLNVAVQSSSFQDSRHYIPFHQYPSFPFFSVSLVFFYPKWHHRHSGDRHQQTQENLKLTKTSTTTLNSPMRTEHALQPWDLDQPFWEMENRVGTVLNGVLWRRARLTHNWNSEQEQLHTAIFFIFFAVTICFFCYCFLPTFAAWNFPFINPCILLVDVY